MAKKQTKKVEVIEEPLVEETVVAEAPQPELVTEPKSKPQRVEKVNPRLDDGWEIKDRLYLLKGNLKPISRSVRSANIYWFDEEKGFERELKYCENQRTTFVDEMKGDQRLSHIIFRSGSLFIPKEKTILQKLLSLYHPDRDKMFYEHKPKVIAENQMEWLEMETDALIAAREIDIDTAEAIMRVESGSKVSNMSSKELRRDLLLFARKKPRLFLDLVNDDNVVLRNFGIKATELNIICSNL